MFYRDYKRFDQQKFETELTLKLNSETNRVFCTFQAVFLEILNKIAPVKVKVLRFNNHTKSLRKAIMLRSRLKNNFYKGLMKTRTTVRSKGIFVLNYCASPKKTILVILMSNVFLTTNNQDTKNSINTYLSELKIFINNFPKEGVFPDDLELVDITPIFKKEDSLKKEIYQPVSILPHLSKVFERILHKQIQSFMKKMFSPYLCGFRKSHNAHYSLLIENWKQQLENGEKVAIIFMDLSKAFDMINHSLLLTNLTACGFSNQTLSYLCNR